MARITDQNKIQRLKQSTMKLVVEKGFGGASAALISKDAQVASGYFYMHYKGKYEMVNSILQEVYAEVLVHFEDLIQHGYSFWETVEKIVRHFIEIANNEPVKIKFLYVLTNDYSFLLDKEIKENTYRIINRLREMGQASGDLDENISDNDLYLIMLATIFQYINLHFKRNETSIQEKETIHLLYLIKKLLK
ncbi:TetR/AcrR family transcriptional regulator [Maribellus sp. YY47]|uniref:TetR/AcrR family transcriptional regulator n=1 Tax=Maribellus sp. YY47 TaxID=2929486 RepID=UPI00200103C3|nr:TetR/AcrR family transcriptional regulator [Maribellus sp. YY47]MCK3683917.1 TetR/AcrR family transcriptional regulator [Maribellus sp. YY47]